jgi:hypothetical protein
VSKDSGAPQKPRYVSLYDCDDKEFDGQILGNGQGSVGIRNANAKGMGEQMLRGEYGGQDGAGTGD